MTTPPASSLETQIDSFLEQFKRSASKAKERRPVSKEYVVSGGIAVNRSQSARFTENDSSSFDDVESVRSESSSRRSQNECSIGTTNQAEEFGVRDVLDLLQSQYAVITGGKSKDGCPIITFPDNSNFQNISDMDYQRLMLYLTSVPSLQEADLGFHLIIDRRKGRWNAVKAVLFKISAYFPGNIHVAYVLRPASLLQKAISEVSNKLFKEEFKFKVIVCSRVDELNSHIDQSQLTADLNGTLIYSHHDWIQQRIELQKFSTMTKELSQNLDTFLSNIMETEFPNNVDATQQLLRQQGLSYSELKDEILSTAKHGENLLTSIRENPASKCSDPSLNENTDRLGNIFAAERLLVQLEENERTFDDIWQQHFTKLQQCLELRRFEQNFKELQNNFDSYLKTVAEMTEIGETVARVDTLIHETSAFQKICTNDIERAEELISSGRQLVKLRNSVSLNSIEPKCTELNRVCEILTERLLKRFDTLTKCRDLMERIEKANQWCANGVEILASQPIEKCSTSAELTEKSLQEIQQFVASAAEFGLSSPREFDNMFQESMTVETKALVTQVLQRIDDVWLMCDKRITNLKKLTLRPPRPVQTVIPEPAMPLQPFGGAPNLCKTVLRKNNVILSKMDCTETVECGVQAAYEGDAEVRNTRRGHTLTELLTTERIYVDEMASILRGYKDIILSVEVNAPSILTDKIGILFGNLDELHIFHGNTFLTDLENCIPSTDLVALCFVQKRDKFYQLYSFYCQNITRSEQLRETFTPEAVAILQQCQQKLGHKLPLAAYLLKPVQRITKYQLLLKDLLRYSDDQNCCQRLQEALDCMLVVLKCVNDSMHQIDMTGVPHDLSQQGELLLQGSFSVWSESKKDLRLRLKAMQRHIFLYQKAMLFCKPASKATHNKATYQFKHYLKMSEIGLTESVKGDSRKFEVWLQGRQEVHTIQASTLEQKQAWVSEIKKVLFDQLKELKGKRIQQYSAANHKPLQQATLWKDNSLSSERAMSLDAEVRSTTSEEVNEGNTCWSSDYSNSEDEDTFTGTTSTLMGGRYIALADYNGVGNSEVSIKEGDCFELLKIGCAGWWFVKNIVTSAEGWAPAAYLESANRKSSRCRSQDRLSDH